MEAIPAPSPRILVVDDDESVRDVISVLLREEGYRCAVASSADMALELAKQEETPIVISDMKMPGKNGLWLLEAFRERDPNTKVIMLTGYGDTEAAVDCLRRGAADYLLKPPRLTDLIRAIERALARRRMELDRKRYQKKLERKVRDRTAELRTALTDVSTTYQNTLLALVTALDAREQETSDHSQRVVQYSIAIARVMSIKGSELDEISRGALLHDIGKIGVPDAVLLKPGKLTPEEWIDMRKHPHIGHSMIAPIPFLKIPAQIVLAHHERFDGRGYPHGLAGQEIPVGARIFSVVDALDAITSDRPYRRASPFSTAVAEIRRHNGSQFDPDVVRAFLEIGEAGLLKISEEMLAKKKATAVAKQQSAGPAAPSSAVAS